MNQYRSEEFNDGKGRQRHGSPVFYALLEQMANVHDKKSYDYASNSSPYANYKFAGMMSKVFDNSDDAGFLGRIGEKIFRLANLENSHKNPVNETVEDTELDICVITALWMASRVERRGSIHYGPEKYMGISNQFKTVESDNQIRDEETIFKLAHSLNLSGIESILQYLNSLRKIKISAEADDNYGNPINRD